MEDITETRVLIQDLVHHFLKKESKDNIESYFLRVFSSHLFSKYSQDENNSFFIMEQNLSLGQRSRLALLVKRLKMIRKNPVRESIFYVLSALKQDQTVAINNDRLECFKDVGGNEVKVEENVIDFTRDLIFSFQGIESRNFSYSEMDSCFVVNSIVPAPLYETSTRLMELGWLYKKIAGFVQKSINSLNSVVLQSLAYKMQKNLNDYFRFIAILHNTSENQAAYVKKIWMNYQDEIEILKCMAIICDGAEGLKGGEIVSSLYNYWRSGSQTIQSLFRPLLEEAAVPFLHMIKSWMIEGELLDTFHEFFIVQDFSVPRKNLWKSMFKINPEMVPCFFSEELTKKILLTGKSLYFMRKECNEEEWSESVAEISSIVGIEQADSHWISRVSQSTNEKLINMLFVKYRLQEHCVMVKKYLLLNQGDFHHALMEGIHSTLDLPPAKIYKHSLVNILEAAIKSSNCQYHDQQFIGRLKVVIEDPKGKNSGWDVFSLEYSVEAPLNTFFSEEISAKYRKVFSFLWKMKRVQFLTHSLDKLKDLIEIQNHPKVFSMLRKMFFIRNQISHFINTFSSYLMVDSIEGLWEKFYLKLNNARDLDELVEIHSSFIDGVMKSCFISEETAFRKILKILDICLNFYHSKKRFLESVKDEHLRMQRPDLDDDILDFVMISQQSFDEIEKISETFPEEILKFKEEELENNDTVKNKNLGVILDFNEFYTNETYVRGCFPEHFSSYREVMQGLNKIARRN